LENLRCYFRQNILKRKKMFQLTRTPFGKFEKIDLSDPISGHGFSFAPAPGATLLSLRFGGVETLDGYQTPDELAAYKWSKSAVLMPFPNRLKDGKMPWQNQHFDWPINNADTGNAIHGYVRERDFEIAEIRLRPTECSVTCRFIETGGFSSFPFPFQFDVIFSMTSTGRFRVAFFCKNLGKTSMPAGFGWHPYFQISGKTADHSFLQLPDCQRVIIDDRMIPTGERTHFNAFSTRKSLLGESLDTGFLAVENKKYRLQFSNLAGRLVIAADAKKWPFFQVFTPPHRQSVALEPMSCNINAHQNGDGLQEILPKKTWRGAMDVHFFRK
jgi:aldose 1-epimerase